MILFEHHFNEWRVSAAKPTGRIRVRTTWYGRHVAQVEEVVAYVRAPSLDAINTKTEARWRDMKKEELKDRTFVCLQ